VLSPIACQKSGAFIPVKKLQKSREKSFTNLKLSDMIVSVRNGSTKIQFIR
jgi:hypothetical protein